MTAVLELERTFASRFGAERVLFVHTASLKAGVCPALEEAIADAVNCVRYADVLTDEPLGVCDLRVLADEDPNVCVVADLARATSAICDPCRKGASACIEQLGELDAAWGDVAAIGFARGEEALADAVAARLSELQLTDETLAASIADGLDEADARVRRSCDAARVAAEYLRCHPRVASVRYPGIKEDPILEAARRMLHHGFGNIINYALVSDPDERMQSIKIDDSDPKNVIEKLEKILAE